MGGLYSDSTRSKLYEVTKIAIQVNPKENVHPMFYVRAGQSMISLAEDLWKDKQLEKAYLVYLRFLTLFIVKMHKHTHYYAHVSHEDRSLMRKYCTVCLPRVEALKRQLIHHYEKEMRASTKVSKTQSAQEQPASKSVLNELPSIRSLMAANFSAKPSVSLKNVPQDALRKVVIPGDADNTFRLKTSERSRIHLPSLAFLAARFPSDEKPFIVSYLIFPRQTSEKHCVVVNPDAKRQASDWARQMKLVLVGFIVSSHHGDLKTLNGSDLHLLFDLQNQVPESVAAVLHFPRNDQPIHIFQLTTLGRNTIGNCSNTEPNHFHEVTPAPKNQKDATSQKLIRLAPHAYFIESEEIVKAMSFL